MKWEIVLNSQFAKVEELLGQKVPTSIYEVILNSCYHKMKWVLIELKIQVGSSTFVNTLDILTKNILSSDIQSFSWNT